MIHEFEAESGRIWRYDDSRVLGSRGLFGTVFEGVGQDDESFAIKVIPDLIDSDHNRESLLREVKLSGFLAAQHHRRPLKHLLVPLDYAVTGDNLYIVLPHATRSLRQAIDHGLSEIEREAAARHAVLGLVELAELAILHRDIKPGNILQTDGVWQLADFGMSRILSEATGPETFVGLGTRQYMAPEIWRSEAADVKSDLYALGCTLTELYTGNPPFPGPNYRAQHLSGVPKLPSGIPLEIRRLILRLLEKDPALRPQDARAALSMLEVPRDKRSRSSVRLLHAAAGAEERLTKHWAEMGAREEGERQYLGGQRQALSDLDVLLHDATQHGKMALPELTLEEQGSQGWVLSTGSVGLRVTVATSLGTRLPTYLLIGEVHYDHSGAGGEDGSGHGLPAVNIVCHLKPDGQVEWQLVSFLRRSNAGGYTTGDAYRPHGLPSSEFPKDLARNGRRVHLPIGSTRYPPVHARTQVDPLTPGRIVALLTESMEATLPKFNWHSVWRFRVLTFMWLLSVVVASSYVPWHAVSGAWWILVVLAYIPPVVVLGILLFEEWQSPPAGRRWDGIRSWWSQF